MDIWRSQRGVHKSCACRRDGGVCVCVCVCVYKGERDREREGPGAIERDRERQGGELIEKEGEREIDRDGEGRGKGGKKTHTHTHTHTGRTALVGVSLCFSCPSHSHCPSSPSGPIIHFLSPLRLPEE